jgi:DeoR/GlpR family transcriptional regulator of sugar metabolism
MHAADEVIVVADSTKFGRQSLAHLCGLGEIQHIVVDDDISTEWRTKIAEAKVELHVAGPDAQTNHK